MDYSLFFSEVKRIYENNKEDTATMLSELDEYITKTCSSMKLNNLLTQEQWFRFNQLHDNSDIEALKYLCGFIGDHPLINRCITLNGALFMTQAEIEHAYHESMMDLMTLIAPKKRNSDINFERGIELMQQRLRDTITAANKADVEEFTALMCSSICSGEDDYESGVFIE